MEKTITLNGIKYIPASEVQKNEPANKKKNMEYVICRTYSAGVFAGYLEKREGKEATLVDARRLWYWKGSASLSQLATEGTSNPEGCKFPCEVSSVILTEVIEIIPCTKKAQESIKKVQIWKQ